VVVVIVKIAVMLVVVILEMLATVGNKSITKTYHSLVIHSIKDHLQWFLVL
jgi:hypothetical protein